MNLILFFINKKFEMFKETNGQSTALLIERKSHFNLVI